MRKCVRYVVATVVVVAIAAGVAIADSTNGGWDGQTPPNNPNYAVSSTQGCINSEEWFLYSTIPSCTPLAHDPQGSAGMFVNAAWKKFTIGRPDVVIAYMEGGINWHDPTARASLAPRAYLNEGELPYPELADGKSCGRYDCNNDGVFNVFDYAQDPRIHKPYINGTLTPEDLIVVFGDCKVNEHTHLIEFCKKGHHYDNDGDGYPNDISGWNFQNSDNDPETNDGAYLHPDWQMERAAAEGNSGVGDVGICPGCMVLPIKAGYEALDRDDRVAQSIYFAIANHASVIILLTAEIGYSQETAAALRYAWKKGVVVVGASNDFDSEDHQTGLFWPNIWPGDGLVSDGTGQIIQAAHTDSLTTEFRSRSNETSFGPHALFSTSNEGGSTSESTPSTAGVAALVISEGRNAFAQHLIDAPLSAGEVEQVVRETASPIDAPTIDWPGKAGATWNIQYGYGRPDVLAAMQAVADNKIPPAPEITSPDWYSLYDPTDTRSVSIGADISAQRATSFTWRVQYGLGDEPTESQFVTIASGSSTRKSLAVLAHLNLSDIPSSFWSAPFHFNAAIEDSTEQYDVTIRVQATDEKGNMGEDRRVIAVFHDPSLVHGYPLRLTDGAPLASTELADLQGTGRLDIIWGDSNGWIHALDPLTRRELPGWPVHTDSVNFSMARHTAGAAVPKQIYEPISSPVAVGDLYGNGALEVVVASETGRVYVFNRYGKEEPGFPKAMGAQFNNLPVPPPHVDYTRLPSEGAFATPVLWHLPGSKTRLDIIQAGWDGYIYAWDGRGHTIPGWPIDAQLPVADRPQSPLIDVHDYKIISTPTLADLYGNGQREIVIKSQEFAYDDSSIVGSLGLGSKFYELAYWDDGNRHSGGALVPGFPIEMQGELGYYGSAQDWITEGGDTPSAAAVPGHTGDTIGQNLVFASPTYLTSSGVASQTQAQPNLITSLAGAAATAQPGLNDDRVATTTTAANPVTFTESGTMAPFDGTMAYLSAGLDLNSLVSLLHNGIAERITNYMFGWNASTGKPLPGFNSAPMMGLPFLTAPAVADISGHGQADVINNEDSNNVAAFMPNGQPVPGWPKFTGGWTVWTPAVGDLFGNGHVEVADLTREGYLFIWNTLGKPSGIESWAWHENDWHTGRYGDQTRPPLLPRHLSLKGSRLCWVAPGGAWGDGTAARYQLRAYSGMARPEPENFTRGRALRGLPVPRAAGTGQCIRVAGLPARTRWLSLRATNGAGLISYPADVRVS
jgi:Subtilase family